MNKKMKNSAKALVLSLFISILAGLAAPVLAYMPVLSASYSGNGNLQVNISYATPFSPVAISERQTSSLWTVVSNIGQTDAGGNFNQSVNMPVDGTSNPIQLFATVGGQQTATISVSPYGGSNNGCTYNCGSPYGLSLSPSSLNLNVGQTSYATVINNNSSYGSIYISSNSNPSIATASVSGNQITVYGQSQGSSSIIVCQNGNSSACATLYVTVSGINNGCSYYGCNTGTLSFSNANPTLSVGQTLGVNIYSSNSYNSNYYISNNSNPSSATASINNQTLTLYGLTQGTSSITVCQNNVSSACASLYLTVSGGTSNNLSLSQTSLNLSAGQSSSVYATGYVGSLYIYSNSNSNIASASVSGSTINIYANQSGSTTVVVCSNNLSGVYSSGNCQNLYITVSGSVAGASNTSVLINDSYYSPQNITITAGSSITWKNNGSMSHSVTFDNSPYYDSGTMYPGSSFTQVFNTPGTYYYHCRFHNGMTGIITVTGNGNGSGNSLSLSQTSLSLNLGQSANVTISGNGYYNIPSNSSPNTVSASISGNNLYVYGQNAGNTILSICQNGSSQCSSLSVAVYSYPNNNGYNNYPSGNSQYPGNGSVLGASLYANGQLLNYGGTIYIVYKNTKTAFANAKAFLGLGFNFNNVSPVLPWAGNSDPLSNSGYVISNSASSHPWGSWIKNGQTVYFVHELGLIPVPNLNTLYANGGQEKLIVNSNVYDFRLPILSTMVVGDSRLQ